MHLNLDIIRSEYGFDIGIEYLSVLVLLIIVAAILREGRINKAHSRYILWLALAQALTLAFDSQTYKLIGIVEKVPLAKTLTILAFICNVAALFVFNCFLISFLRERTFIIDELLYFIAFVCGGDAIVYIVGAFQPKPWFMYFDEGGVYHTTTGYYVIVLVLMLILLFDAVLLISCRKGLSRTELYTWLSYEAFPVITFVAYAAFGLPESVSMISGALSVILLYTNLHVVRTQELADDELELSESKVKLLISQMQPHFMYNSLNSIYYLIGKDPDTAKDALNTFSGYLRDNINSLRDSKTIPIEEELRHIDAYLKMEKLRFGDDLNFEFDLKEKGFYIPALSIQPLVENAVKHGVSQKEEGGTVWVSTYSDENNYYVKIEDDGVGFDAGSYRDNDATSHIGIFNVNSRIKIMCHGKLIVESEPGKGTVSLVVLPKDGQKEYIESKGKK